jgi:RimJ/RimL family protein N-acetyltransferase
MNSYVELVEYDKSFLDKSYEWLTDPYIKAMTDTPTLTKESQIKWFESLPEKKDYFIWGIKYQGLPIGACGLKHVHDKTAECWWYIGDRSAHGKGVGFSMSQLVLQKAKEMGLSVVWCTVLIENVISENLLKKIGFIRYDSDERHHYLKINL